MILCGFEVGMSIPIQSNLYSLRSLLQVSLKKSLARNIHFIYSSSFFKDNSNSGKIKRGLDIKERLRILTEVRRQIGVPVLADVHMVEQVPIVAAVVKALQILVFFFIISTNKLTNNNDDE